MAQLAAHEGEPGDREKDKHLMVFPLICGMVRMMLAIIYRIIIYLIISTAETVLLAALYGYVIQKNYS